MRRAAIFSTLIWLAAAAPAAAVICTSDTVPAATLLLPYFEVDLDNLFGTTTLFSVNNGSAEAVLTNVVIWSDLAVPVLGFSLYLTGYDVQSINLRDIIANGNLPQTASAGQDPTDTISPQGAFSQDSNFASCGGVLPPPPLPSVFTAHMQSSLTGKASSILGGRCAGQNLGDNIARGYITVDTVSNCTLRFPGDIGYFAAGGTGDATNQNVLWGDWAIVAGVPSHSPQGGMLVHVEADASNPATSTSGRYTFYGRLDGFTAVDNREPLSTLFATRYLNAFGFNTALLVWRDPKVAQQPFSCPATPQVRPAWYPLGQEAVVVFDEQEHPSVATTSSDSPSPPGSITAFGAATQRVQVGSPSLPSPFQFGWILLDLNTHVAQAASLPPFDSAAAQGWIFATHASPSTYSYTTDAARFDSACAPRHFSVPPGVTGFFTVPPCRLVDTRGPAGPYGGPSLAGGSGRLFDLAGLCGIPPTVKAISLNVTVTSATDSGALRLFRGGIAMPNASAISFAAGQTRANNGVIGLTQDGRGTLDIFADMASGTVDVIVDVNGYFQ